MVYLGTGNEQIGAWLVASLVRRRDGVAHTLHKRIVVASKLAQHIGSIGSTVGFLNRRELGEFSVASN